MKGSAYFDKLIFCNLHLKPSTRVFSVPVSIEITTTVTEIDPATLSLLLNSSRLNVNGHMYLRGHCCSLCPRSA